METTFPVPDSRPVTGPVLIPEPVVSAVPELFLLSFGAPEETREPFAFAVPDIPGVAGLSDRTGALVEPQPDKRDIARRVALEKRVSFDTKFMNTYPYEITT